ncbi:MAG: HDOD domain-containing protein [Myxococcales bacterium]|nr:HDOD domain-containing protein [Myxococcales bacterium]
MRTAIPSALFLEADPAVLRGLASLLRRQLPDWRLAFAATPAQALASLREHGADVVVSEADLPEMSGGHFLREVQRERPETVRILFTSYATDELVTELAPVAHQMLAKPMEATALGLALRQAWRLGQMLREPALRALVSEDNRLPVVPRCFAELSRVMGGTKVSVAEVAEVLECDPGLAARVMQVARSALFGGRAAPRTVRDAVVRLGLDLTRGITLSEELTRLLPHPVAGLSTRAHGLLALRTGLLLKHMARDVDAEDALMTGIVHGVGKLLLASRRPGLFAECFTESVARGVDIAEVLDEKLGATDAELGAYLLGIWRFPPSIVTAVSRQYRPEAIGPQGPGACDSLYLARRFAADPEVPVVEGIKGVDAGVDAGALRRWGKLAEVAEWRVVARDIVSADICCG